MIPEYPGNHFFVFYQEYINILRRFIENTGLII